MNFSNQQNVTNELNLAKVPSQHSRLFKIGSNYDFSFRNIMNFSDSLNDTELSNLTLGEFISIIKNEKSNFENKSRYTE